MTTALAHAVRGRVLAAFHAQPAGLVFALGLFACTLCCLRIVITGNYDFMKICAHPGILH
jgi:hypothetical protein